MTSEDLLSALAVLTTQTGDKRFLIVSRSERPSTPEKYFPDESSVEWLGDIQSAASLGAIERADLGLVFDQVEHMQKEEGVHLLSRLRDHHCRRTLLHCAGRVYSNQELLALGFIEQKCPSHGGHFFLFDPDIFFERREWNTPGKWANPQNFKKNRW